MRQEEKIQRKKIRLEAKKDKAKTLAEKKALVWFLLCVSVLFVHIIKEYSQVH